MQSSLQGQKASSSADSPPSFFPWPMALVCFFANNTCAKDRKSTHFCPTTNCSIFFLLLFLNSVGIWSQNILSYNFKTVMHLSKCWNASLRQMFLVRCEKSITAKKRVNREGIKNACRRPPEEITFCWENISIKLLLLALFSCISTKWNWTMQRSFIILSQVP